MPVGPYKHVHTDLPGPFDTALIDIHGEVTEVEKPDKPVKAHVVLIIDYLTKAAGFIPAIARTKPQAVAEAFCYAWICRNCNCEIVTSDNGTEFAEEFTHTLAQLGVGICIPQPAIQQQMVLLSGL
jgi:hypothetical protein